MSLVTVIVTVIVSPIFIVALGTLTLLIFGALVSTRTLVVVGAVKVRPASLPAASLIVPLFKARGEAEAIPSLSVSPACTV